MTFGMLETGLRTADFDCCDDVELKPFIGLCRVQIMRDGNVYMTEQPRRVKNKALFREDNMSLSLGRDGMWYGVFRLPDSEIDKLPEKLTKQSIRLADKVRMMLIEKGKKGGKRA